MQRWFSYYLYFLKEAFPLKILQKIEGMIVWDLESFVDHWMETWWEGAVWSQAAAIHWLVLMLGMCRQSKVSTYPLLFIIYTFLLLFLFCPCIPTPFAIIIHTLIPPRKFLELFSSFLFSFFSFSTWKFGEIAWKFLLNIVFVKSFFFDNFCVL